MRNSGTFIWMLITIATSLVWSSPVWAETKLLPKGFVLYEQYEPGRGKSVGFVQALQGDAVIIHQDQSHGYYVKAGYALFAKDTLVTLETGYLRVRMNDGSLLTFQPNARLTIDQFTYMPKKKQRRSFMRQALGKIKFWVKKLSGFKRTQFRIQTRTAVAGVRGSEFTIEATDFSTRITTAADTKLEVISRKAPFASVVLGDFQQTYIPLDGKPTTPVDISPEKAASGWDPFSGSGGSSVSDSVLVNRSEIRNSTNVAIGRNNDAQMGSTKIKNSTVKKSTILNKSRIRNSTNTAIGRDNQAVTGSVVID